MAAKTIAQWRREVPAYDKMVRAVQHLIVAWPQTGPAPRMIAHIHPDTQVVSMILDGTTGDCAVADQLLAGRGYRTGWIFDTAVHPVWRKVAS